MRKVVAVCLAVLLVFLVGERAISSPPDAARLFGLANKSRARHRLPGLIWSEDLHHVAAQAAVWMAENHTVRDPHAPCSYGGSNAGVGPSIRRLHRAFMASHDHRMNILNGHFVHAATASRRDERGNLWVAEVFCAG